MQRDARGTEREEVKKPGSENGKKGTLLLEQREREREREGIRRRNM
jgi:hypothetical protein